MMCWRCNKRIKCDDVLKLDRFMSKCNERVNERMGIVMELNSNYRSNELICNNCIVEIVRDELVNDLMVIGKYR